MEKNPETIWIKLKLNFFAHSKVRFMLRKHGAVGPFCVLAIWAQMIDREGIFDARREFDLEGIADSCGIQKELVLEIIDTAVSIELLQKSAEKGTYEKDRIWDHLELQAHFKSRASKGGKASAEKRRIQSKNGIISTSSTANGTTQVHLAPTKEGRKEGEKDSLSSVGEDKLSVTHHSVDRATTPRPFGAWVAEEFKVGVTDEQSRIISQIGEQIKKWPDADRAKFKRIFTDPSEYMKREIHDRQYCDGPHAMIENIFENFEVEYADYLKQKQDDAEAFAKEPEELP